MSKPSPTSTGNGAPLRLGLIGFGCVGQGLYDILQKLPDVGFEVRRIAVKNPTKLRPLPADRFEFHADDLLDDPELDVLVEVIDDPNEAFRLVSRALRQGRNVVTANKAMVARHLPELIRLQREFGGTLLYEAAVCGSIPVIRTLDSYFGQEPLPSVSGIFNGSSNYVLTGMTTAGADYATVLAEAQAQGFAETDPALDMAAFDPRSKAVILAAHAYGLLLNPDQVLNLGIESISSTDIRFAAERGQKIKVVATLQRLSDGSAAVFVAPQFVGDDSPLYHVEREFNGVVVEAEFAGQHFWRGRGAGGHPTGSAVLADLVALRNGFRYAYPKLNTATVPEPAADLEVEIYLRHAPKDLREKLHLTDVVDELNAPGFSYHYVVGYARLSTLLRHRDDLRRAGTFVARTGPVRTPVGVVQQQAAAELVVE
ncbi:homoserine dehydrogenase [Hymenobacter busanensis]|uniref:Homoserine dehydrogenase n=1 Tax=Hymenobacter busanensis TaxID=2607656 RepID=A0A7L4ZXJ8_9BACT|nr:homoserine dehydrogenase [Hymenobacter busanensis]KAA9325561.1 homoserine dehydrogenase [Hymenobacter busanensis]QHJ07767.1 homoserine dehydrogenase [Hymenobacter busanensis]